MSDTNLEEVFKITLRQINEGSLTRRFERRDYSNWNNRAAAAAMREPEGPTERGRSNRSNAVFRHGLIRSGLTSE